jgi:hypothetical protein
MSVTIQCIKRTDIMSSLSPNEDTRRMSPRKSAGQMPHYLAREYNGQKRGKEGMKSGGGVKKWVKEGYSLSELWALFSTTDEQWIPQCSPH